MRDHKFELLNGLLDASESGDIEWATGSSVTSVTARFGELNVTIYPPNGYESGVAIGFNGWKLVIFDRHGSPVMEISDNHITRRYNPTIAEIYELARQSLMDKEAGIIDQILNIVRNKQK